MRLGRFLTIVIGLVSCVPLVFVLFFKFYILPMFATLGHPGGIPVGVYFETFWTVFIGFIAVLVLTVLLLVLYARLIRLEPPQRHRNVLFHWAALWLGGIVTMPILWYLLLWRRLGDAQSAERIDGKELRP